MYSTTAYLYHQKQQVLLLNTSGAYFDRRWQPVYAKNLKINRGVDNVILFEFINQDQKPVNISGSTITFRLISENGQGGQKELLAKDLVTLNATSGRAKVTVSEEDLDSIDAQVANWSLERASGDLYEPVFVDDYAGGRGTCDIVGSTYPDFHVSQHMHIPSFQTQSVESKNRIHTSIIEGYDQTLHTFQFSLSNFTGNVKAQGSKTQLGPWYDINSQKSWTNKLGHDYLNVTGRHEFIRFEINQYGNNATATASVSSGSVTDLTLDNGGEDFFTTGTANVVIEGLGTGAAGTTTISSNSVSSISVTQGGVGYVTAPTVKIDLGRIISIKYR